MKPSTKSYYTVKSPGSELVFYACKTCESIFMGESQVILCKHSIGKNNKDHNHVFSRYKLSDIKNTELFSIVDLAIED